MLMGLSEKEARAGEPQSGGGYEVPTDVEMSVLHEAIYNGVREMMNSRDYDDSDLPISITDNDNGVFTVEFPVGHDYEIILKRK